MWETQIEFQVPGFGLSHLDVVAHLGMKQKIDDDSFLSLAVFLLLCLSK